VIYQIAPLSSTPVADIFKFNVVESAACFT